MREPGLEALRVLRGKADAAALRPADHQRHGRRAAQHVAELGGLVDDHVHHQGHEVEDLDLDDRPHAGDRSADAGAAEGRLGDRRVAHPLAPEAVQQALADLEDAAGIRHVLAHQEHARVALHLLRHRLVQRLREGQLTGAALFGLLMRDVRRVDRGRQHVLLGLGAAFGERHRLVQLARRRRVDRIEIAGRHDLALDQHVVQARDRAARHPRGHLLLGARVAQVGAHAVLAPAPGHRLDQARAVAGAGAGDRLADRVMHREHVVAVDRAAGDAVGRRALGDRIRPRWCGGRRC